MKKKHILIASTPNGQYRTEEALSQKYSLRFASTLREAELLLTESESKFDMVMCGIHFDDSRMFELLQFVRTGDGLENLPFIVFQARHSVLNDMDNVKATAEKLGACGFLELHSLSQAESNKLLQTFVGRSFEKTVRRQRLDTSTAFPK